MKLIFKLSIRRCFFAVVFVCFLADTRAGISQSLSDYQSTQKPYQPMSSGKKAVVHWLKSNNEPQTISTDDAYGTFGFSFGMGLMESDFTYNWQYVYQLTSVLAMEGSFKHVLGETADSYFLTAGFSYLLVKSKSIQSFINAGMGVINTIPQRSIDTNEISHMTINYGVGIRKNIRTNMALVLSANQYSVFLRNGFTHFTEYTLGLLVGNFWD